MVQLLEGGAYLLNGTEIVPDTKDAASVLESQLGSVPSKEDAKKQTIAYGILESHNTSGNMEKLEIKFDKLTLHLWALFRRPALQGWRNSRSLMS